MDKYTLKYRKIGSAFWFTIKDVVSDGVFENLSIRWFCTQSGYTYEISTVGTIFKLHPDRQKLVGDQEANS